MNRRIIVPALIAICLMVFPTMALASNTESFAVFTQGLEMEKQLLIFEARDDFKRAIALESDNAGYLSHYAWFLTSYGFIEEAADIFERLLPLTDDKRAAYLGLGFTNQQLGRFDTSLSAYKNCFSINSSDKKASFEQIKWALSQDNKEKIDSLIKKRPNQPDPGETEKELLRVYIDQGELLNAIETAEGLRENGQLDLTSHLWFARALYWSGEEIRAEKEYSYLISESPKSAFLYMELAALQESEGSLNDAKKTLETALSLYPDAVQIKKKLAEIYARTGAYNKACSIADSIPDIGHDRLTGIMAKARVFHFSGLIEEARLHYKRILNEYPYNADALWGMSETSAYSGRYSAALHTIELWEDNLSDPRLDAQKKLIGLYTAPQAELKMELYDNSSNFSRKNAGTEFSIYAGDDLRIGSGYTFSKFSQEGFKNISRHSLLLSVEKDLSTFVQMDGRIVGNIYDNGNNLLNTRIGATLSVSPRLSINPYFRHFDIIDTVAPFENALYSHVVTIGSVGMGITSDEYNLKVNYMPLPLLSFAGDYQYGNYSDGNKKQALTIGTEYRLALQPDWRIAYNYFYLDYKDPAPVYREGYYSESAYYDPINFESHTLTINYRHNKGGDLSWGLEGSFSFLPKVNGIGRLLSSFGEWRLDEGISLRLDTRWFYNDKGVGRIGETEYFRAKNILLTFKYRFH